MFGPPLKPLSGLFSDDDADDSLAAQLERKNMADAKLEADKEVYAKKFEKANVTEGPN